MPIERRTAAKVAWWIWGALAAMAAAVPALQFLGRSDENPADAGFALFAVAAGVGAFAPVGALIVARRGNSVGWTLLAIGAGFVITIFTGSFAVAAVSRPGGLPGWRFVAWIGMWLWIPSAGAVALLLLLFPTGHLPSRRWRALVWISAAGIAVATVATALNPIRFELTAGIGLDNPFGLHGWGGILSAIIGASAAVIFPAVVLTLVSLVIRYRRGSSDEREQIKWLAYVAVADAAILIIGIGITPICSACESGAFSDIGFGMPSWPWASRPR